MKKGTYKEKQPRKRKYLWYLVRYQESHQSKKMYKNTLWISGENQTHIWAQVTHSSQGLGLIVVK